METPKMAASCGKRLQVRQSGSGFELVEACPAGHQPGTPVAQLLDLCVDCEHRSQITVTKKTKEGETVLSGPAVELGKNTTPASAPLPNAPVSATPPAPALPPLPEAVEPPPPPPAAVQPVPQAQPAPLAAPQAQVPVAPEPPVETPPPPPVAASEAPEAPPAPAAPSPPPVTPEAPVAPVGAAVLDMAAIDQGAESMNEPEPEPAPAPVQPAPSPLEYPNTSPPLQVSRDQYNAVPPPMPPRPVTAALPPEQPVLGAVQVPEIPLSSIMLPGGVSLSGVADPESAVDISAVVSAQIPDLPGGPSEGGLSPHTLDDAKCWRKFYLGHIVGLVSREESYALRFGTLLHYCAAARFLFGAERQYEPCNVVAQAGAAEMAAKVKELFAGAVDKYGTEEWETWCVRAVEYNMLGFLECPVGKRTKKVPITSRIDMILGLKDKDQPHPAGGPYPGGVYLVDWKTCSAMTRDLLEGYGMDWQFNTQAVVFAVGGYEPVFGPLRGTMVGLFSKARKVPTPDSYARIRAPISQRGVEEFRDTQLAPLAGEVYRRLCESEDYKSDPANWPKDYRQCNGRWGRCDYFDICEGMGTSVQEIAYKVDESRIMSVEKFAEPTGPAAPPAQQAAKKAAKARSAAADPASDEMTGVWSRMLLSQIEGGHEAYAPLRKENYLTPGHTKDTVVRGMTDALRSLYEPFANGKIKQDYQGAQWSFSKTGISWKMNGSKGRVTWKGIATWIAENIWFDLSQATPE